MAELPVGKGKVAFVDDADLLRVSQWKWHVDHGYVRRRARVAGKQTVVYLHRFIVGAPDGIGIDHRDRDGLNNRRDNLRVAGQTLNNANSRLRSNKRHSKFRGVTLFRTSKVVNGKRYEYLYWQARIQSAGVARHLGYFEVEEDAARAYDAAARVLFGEFASLNLP